MDKKTLIALMVIISIGIIFWQTAKAPTNETNNATPSATITESDARTIAESSCIKSGETLGASFYNENSRTWWFDANLIPAKQGCNPACVVSENTKTAEINWRCTGLVPPPQEDNGSAGNTIPCTAEQRGGNVCPSLWAPVCAKVNVVCVKAPCNPVEQQFPNSCAACQNPLVESYTNGTCDGKTNGVPPMIPIQ